MNKRKQDFSCGIVPIYKEGRYCYVFILKHRGGYWSFPKGHPNDGETNIETATRELYEETKLEIGEVIFDQVLEERYTFKQNQEMIHKKVHYYVASIKNPKDFEIDLEEAIEGKWVDINQAPMFLTFEEAKKICREVAQLVQGK